MGAATMPNPVPIHSAGFNAEHFLQHMASKSNEITQRLCFPTKGLALQAKVFVFIFNFFSTRDSETPVVQL